MNPDRLGNQEQSPVRTALLVLVLYIQSCTVQSCTVLPISVALPHGGSPDEPLMMEQKGVLRIIVVVKPVRTLRSTVSTVLYSSVS
jgi:hypothetical protein